jgi:hypothetical protein
MAVETWHSIKTEISKASPEFHRIPEKKRLREEKGTGDIGRQDADATICGITWPDSVPGD